MDQGKRKKRRTSRCAGSPINPAFGELRVWPYMDEKDVADVNAAADSFQRTRAPISRVDAPSRSGVYTIYLCPRNLLAPFAEGENGLIYIGLSARLSDREFSQHFSSNSTGFSTLRRSLGAVLKDQLSLRAIQRASGTSESNVRNYRFDAKGEEVLTKWMCEHLEVGIYVTDRYKELENLLVPHLKPLLNLTKWKNPYRLAIKGLRKVCANEARQVRLQARHSKPLQPIAGKTRSG